MNLTPEVEAYLAILQLFSRRFPGIAWPLETGLNKYHPVTPHQEGELIARTFWRINGL